MRQQFEISDHLPVPTYAKANIFESQQFYLYFSLPSLTFQIHQQLKGHIVIEPKINLPNFDINLKFNGVCIYYSQNPNKEIDVTEHSFFDKQPSMIQQLSSKDRNPSAIQSRVETFLEGAQTLYYLLEGQKDVQILEKQQKYYLPFSFYIPPNSPPSIAFLSFKPLFIEIKYFLTIENMFQQVITLKENQKNNLIEQFVCNTIDFSVRKCCFNCLGDYRLEICLTLNEDVLKVKLLYYKKAVKGSTLFVKSVKIKLMGEIPQIGKHVMAKRQLRLQVFQLGIFSNEFVLQKIKSNFKSFNNELFRLIYYLQIQLIPIDNVTLYNFEEERHQIPL